VLALGRLLEGGGSDVLNLGTGTGASVLELLATVERVTGRAVPYTVGPRREGDPPALVSQGTKAMRELGWKPRLSDLDTIVGSAWNWHRKMHHNA
jgi:UDP-glucose 4-epimerase